MNLSQFLLVEADFSVGFANYFQRSLAGCLCAVKIKLSDCLGGLHEFLRINF